MNIDRARRIVLPRAVTTAPVVRQDQVGDVDLGLPHVLKELWDDIDDKIAKYEAAGQDATMWRGYRLGLADVWKCFKHLYEE